MGQIIEYIPGMPCSFVCDFVCCGSVFTYPTPCHRHFYMEFDIPGDIRYPIAPVTYTNSSFFSWLVTLLTYTDRLYLASYINPPTADTLFPYPDPPAKSPSKRSQRAAEGPAPVPVAPKARKQPYYFTVDDTLLYNAFHHDFGPLHIGHLYRFALQFHEILGAKENNDRPVVFYSMADPRSTWQQCPPPSTCSILHLYLL